jgi:hypothetical protein
MTDEVSVRVGVEVVEEAMVFVGVVGFVFGRLREKRRKE